MGCLHSRSSWGFGEQVLNRIFVLIGVLVILAIGAAFIVPRFIQWGEYRERLQTMGAELTGPDARGGPMAARAQGGKHA